MFQKSQQLWAKANNYLIGGVNSPVRAFKAVGGTPVYMDRASGPCLYDVDGNKYYDYVASWGPMILGHSHPEVIASIRESINKGTSFGTCTESEIRLAQLIVELVPSIEKVRMINSGTEATMTAIRLARGFTGRDKVVKFEGCYHGHVDSLLVKAGSGATTLGIPDSKGITPSQAKDTLTLPFNDIAAVKRLFKDKGKEIAALILEPVVGNMGVVPPCEGFLEGLRTLTKECDSLLIFDEVMTGFRLAIGGAQELYGIIPDLTCLGKIIGGGLPVGAVGGKKEIMDYLSPIGPVYQAGTLSGNPVAMTSGVKTLEILKVKDSYKALDKKGEKLAQGLRDAAKAAQIDLHVNRVGSMLSPFFTPHSVVDYSTAKTSDTKRYAHFFWSLLEKGVYVPPSQFESHFISLAHTDEDLDRTIEAVYSAMKKVCRV